MSSYNISDCIPEIGYIGAVDINSSLFGTTMYSVFYDADISNLGNVLMFEYQLIEGNVTAPNPGNVTFGFVSIENATNTGISNQWTVAIPANAIYNDVKNLKISLRVYVGVTGSAEVAVTKWSNQLDVHNPPVKPVILNALYDAPSKDKDDLFIFLQDNNVYDDNINFVVAYYYQDASGVTVWDVSSPTEAVSVLRDSNNLLMIQVPEFGTVSTVDTYSKVYVAVYAVYTFKDNSNNNYYTVSDVSETFVAQPTTLFNKPVIYDIGYSVYTDNLQKMTVKWNAPAISSIPVYEVDKYRVFCKINNESDWTFLDEVSGTQFQYVHDVSDESCNTTINFRVQAVSIYGTISPPSDPKSKKIYKRSQAPQDLVITNTAYTHATSNSDENVVMDINFKNPLDNDTGCGDPDEYVIYVNSEEVGRIDYDKNKSQYVFSYSGEQTQTGNVSVTLTTKDTNSNEYISGFSAESPYIATDLILKPVEYQVYTNKITQIMKLLWNKQDKLGWTVMYEAQYKLNDGLWIQFGNTSENSIEFNTAGFGDEDLLYFRIKCFLTNSGTVYSFYSNIESQFIFRFAQAPLAKVVWSSSNNNNTKMDMNLQIENPSDTGNGDVEHIRYEILKANGDLILSKIIEYNKSLSYYTEYPDDMSYNRTGFVTVVIVTRNKNNSSQLLDGISYTASYTTEALPILDNVNVNEAKTILTFKIFSYTDLSKFGAFIYNNSSGENVVVKWATVSNVTDTLVSTKLTLANDSRQYTVTMNSRAVGLNVFPTKFVVVASNTNGVGHASYKVPNVM
jgi:hypothetical protein